jgi:hypothetical protein
MAITKRRFISPPERVHNHEGHAPIAVPAHTPLNKGRKRSAIPPAVIAILFLNALVFNVLRG